MNCEQAVVLNKSRRSQDLKSRALKQGRDDTLLSTVLGRGQDSTNRP